VIFSMPCVFDTPQTFRGFCGTPPKTVILSEAPYRSIGCNSRVARSRRTSAMLVGRCCTELSTTEAASRGAESKESLKVVAGKPRTVSASKHRRGPSASRYTAIAPDRSIRRFAQDDGFRGHEKAPKQVSSCETESWVNPKETTFQTACSSPRREWMLLNCVAA
jgi:hypothetical protein